MDLKEIKVIIDLMKKNSLSEFELEKEGFRIKLKRTVEGQVVSLPPAPAAPTPPPAPAA
ncbi:MAG: acetyl-CoA carboxylase, biotin carboxyl carrier protein, partial [Verrucomicrobia bacterium]